MWFLHPSPYEFGGSPDIDAEDAILAANGIRPYNGLELGLIPLEVADPVDTDGVRSVEGFSLTALPTGSIETRLGIGDAAERLQAGLEGTFYDRVIGTAQIGLDGTVISEPTMRPL
jgi:hypothetical protein